MATGETGFDDVTFDLISLQVRDFGGPRRQGAPPSWDDGDDSGRGSRNPWRGGRLRG
jgi:hypothetical protein